MAEMITTKRRRRAGRWVRIRNTALATVAAALAWVSGPVAGSAATDPQASFATPERAVEALVGAAREGRTNDLVRILGPGSRKLVYSGDAVADRTGREKFVAAYETAHKIEQDAEGNDTLVIGRDAWPFPIPIVKRGDRWVFDTKAGDKEILARRIGRNELSVIEVCRAYVDAQREYASRDRNGDGVLEYAQSFISRRGKENGLYWPVKAGEPQSPLGPLMAEARTEGYGGKAARGKRQPYHGYYYKILKAQGQHAPGGAYSYLANGRMIGGFALVAYPSRYGVSGIMTFIVSHDGKVYEKNLGPRTVSIARAMTAYDPDSSWKAP
jgi:Protein of unknown function (DUF2950)